MTTKKLLVSFITIFIIVFAAYILISPIATKTLEAPVMETSKEDIATSTLDNSQGEAVLPPTVNPTVTNTPKPTLTTETQTTVTPAPVVVPTPAPVTEGYTSAEVATHSTESSCWSIVNGNVYNLTSYISKHPGGSSKIIRICGKDGTSAFEGEHGGDSKPEKILASYKIGPLK